MDTNQGRAARAERPAYIAPVPDRSVRELLMQGVSDQEIAEALFGVLRDFDRPENRLAFERGYFAGRRGTGTTEGNS